MPPADNTKNTNTQAVKHLPIPDMKDVKGFRVYRPPKGHKFLLDWK